MGGVGPGPIGLGAGIPVGPPWFAICAGGGCDELGVDFLLFILAMRRTLRLRSRGSWLLLRQLSTALWIRPRFPRNEAFNCAKAHPTLLQSVSYIKRLPRYCSLGQQALGYTQFSCLNSGDSSSVLTDSTSQRMVYSILTRSREYSKAIHCTPFPSCLTTNGVVAGIGPGAALGLTAAFWLPGLCNWGGAC